LEFGDELPFLRLARCPPRRSRDAEIRQNAWHCLFEGLNEVFVFSLFRRNTAQPDATRLNDRQPAGQLHQQVFGAQETVK
jgi:hypothetical protein